MKKIIAFLLVFTVMFTFGVPAFAAEETTETPQITEEEILDIVTSDEFKETLEEEGYDVEEFEEKIESGDYEIIEEDERSLTYKDRFTFVMELSGELFILSFSTGIMSGTMGLIFPGLIFFTLPIGVLLFIAGVGTVVTSPILALILPESYILENTYHSYY